MGVDAQLAQRVCAAVSEWFGDRGGLSLLEAGCGSASYFAFSKVARTVGIDISQAQLDRNAAVQEKILGDLQTYALPAGEFDIAVCWDVIEHLERPRAALVNLFNSVRPGGVIVLGFPNVMSFKGLGTKWTPYGLHKLAYRLMGYRSVPFPTYLRLAIRPKSVVRLARECGLSVALFELLEGTMTRKFRARSRVVGGMLRLTDGLVKAVSFGSCESLFLDSCVLVLRKQEGPAAPAAVGRPAGGGQSLTNSER